MILDEHEASLLADLLIDYCEDAPGYDCAMQKLLAARDSPQKFTEADLLLVLDAIKEYFSDTAGLLTPSYDSDSLDSFSDSGIFAEREAIFFLRERILQDLPRPQSES